MVKTKTSQDKTTRRKKTSANHLPPAVLKALKAKGWTWPPDEKLQKQMAEAGNRMSGSGHTPPEILKETWETLRGHYWDVSKKKKLWRRS